MTQIRKMTVATTAVKQNRANPIIAESKPYMYLRMLIKARNLAYHDLAKEEPDA